MLEQENAGKRNAVLVEVERYLGLYGETERFVHPFVPRICFWTTQA